MSDYSAVAQQLEAGTEPALLCATCPWDRTCVTPPAMSKADIDARIAEASAEDKRHQAARAAAGKDPGMPVGTLMTTLIFGGRDQAAAVCPVFALRLRSSGGRQIADEIKARMTGWDDQA